MLKLTVKSCGLYCQTIYVNSMSEMPVIDHKVRISEISIPGHSFTILLQISMTLDFLMPI